MTPAPSPSVDELLPILTRDVIEAIADRPNESEARRQARAQGAMRLIEAFEPEDGVEIMLAGQTVLMQNLLLDAVHDVHRATTTDYAFRHRQQAMSMGRLQLSWLKEISRRHADRARPIEDVSVQTRSPPFPTAEASADVPPPPRTEPAQAARPAPAAQRAPVPAPAAQPAPSPAAVASAPAVQPASAPAAQPALAPAAQPAPSAEASKSGPSPLAARPSPPMPPPSLVARPAAALAGA